MQIVFMGPPGAGKGTQATILKNRYDIAHLSTGDMLRAVAKQDNPLGVELKGIMEAGQLVSDDIMIKMIAARIQEEDCAKGFILDGFPRTAAQAAALDVMLEDKALQIDHVLLLDVDEAVLVERIVGRFSCANCGAGYHKTFQLPKADGVCDHCGGTEFKQRSDDNESTVKKRFAAYREQTAELVPFYEQKQLLRRVDAMQPIDAVTASIEKALN